MKKNKTNELPRGRLPFEIKLYQDASPKNQNTSKQKRNASGRDSRNTSRQNQNASGQNPQNTSKQNQNTSKQNQNASGRDSRNTSKQNQNASLNLDDLDFEIHHLGGGALAKAMFEKMGLTETIDKYCPPDPRMKLTHGQVIEILACNLLIQPTAMWKVEEWASLAGLKDAYGIDPGKLNDDRIATHFSH